MGLWQCPAYPQTPGHGAAGVHEEKVIPELLDKGSPELKGQSDDSTVFRTFASNAAIWFYPQYPKHFQE